MTAVIVQGRRLARMRTGLTPTAAAVAAVAALSALQAHAQQAQQVTVTGIRSAIESAISVKKNADGVTESLSAEDIGKLPDTTIAESLARLPGVTAQRTREGSASAISIRGLGPDFSGYLINGREQAGIGNSRALDLSVYPAELIGGATIYKTADAALIGGGLAGTIDQKLIDPTLYRNRVIAASRTKVRTGVGLDKDKEGTGSRTSLTYIDNFADRKIGVALGFVRVDGTTSQFTCCGWGDGTVTAYTGATATGTGIANVKVPSFGSGLDYSTRRYTDDRTGVAAILTFKPSQNWNSQLDYFQTKADTITKITAVKAGLYPYNTITNATVVNGVATKGTYTLNSSDPAGKIIGFSEGITYDDTIKTLGWKNTIKLDGGWQATVDLNKASAQRIERDNEAYAGITGVDTLTFEYGGSGAPKLTMGNPLNYTNPTLFQVRDQSGWSGIDGVPQAGYSKGPTIKDKVDGIRVDLKKDLAAGAFTELQFGANHTNRKKDRITDEGLIVSTTGGGKDRISMPSDAYVENNVGGTGLNLLTFDPKASLWSGATVLRKYNDDILSKTWGVEEKVTTAYAKLAVDTKMAGVPVRGNVGAQVVNTDQQSSGYLAGVGSNVVLVNPSKGITTAGTSYTDLLPSVNLAGDLGGGNLLRFGLGKQLARADLTDQRNSFAASVDTNPANTATFGRFVGSGGNPFLKPYRATALDLSFEKYLGTKAYFAAAVFYKDLDTYITKFTDTAYNFSSYASQLGLSIPAKGAVGTFTQAVNGSGGTLRGLELSASAPLSVLAEPLRAFGVSTSYSNTSSSVNLPVGLLGANPNQPLGTSTQRIPLPGLSKGNTKFMLYYDQSGLQASVAMNRRTTYVGSVANDAVGGYPTLRYIQGSAWVSAQIGYELQSGYLKGLSVRFEGNNLNKPVYRQLKADGVTVDSEIKTGAAYALRVGYKF